MSSPSGDFRAISTPRPPPISGHLGENEVPTFEQQNGDLLFTPSPGSGGRARRRTRVQIYGSRPTRTTSRRVDAARDRGVISAPEVPFFDRRGKNLTTAQKARFVAAVKDGLARIPPITIAETTEQFGLGVNAYSRYNKQILEGTCDPKPKSGRPRKLDKAHLEILMDINEKHRGALTFVEMAREFTKKCFPISATMVHAIFHRDGWRAIRKRSCPILTKEHMEQRRLWALEHCRTNPNNWGDDDTVWIDIDEILLPMIQFRGKRKLSPRDMERDGIGGHVSRLPINSRHHIPSMMYLNAVAKPNKKQKFDGKLGIFPFATMTKTKRKSKNRAAGVDELEIIPSVTAEVFADYIMEKLLPEIQLKCGWAKHIVIQYDGATPHKAGIKLMEEAGLAEVENRLTWHKQPPHSPDTNLNDLCFFNSLKAALAKTRKDGWGFLKFDEQVQKVYRAWHNDVKLIKLWKLKTAVAWKILTNDGNNQFAMPHSKIKGVPLKPPTNGAVEEYVICDECDETE
jgi:transposase